MKHHITCDSTKLTYMMTESLLFVHGVENNTIGEISGTHAP